ncbi:MAG: DUF3710 domain-containing protein [Micromonosporaceae bacterium]|nr:DUF3710 domain-containing protein [Micromonosporaceae bacterium]
MFSRSSRSAGRHARADRSRREPGSGRPSLADELAVADELDGPDDDRGRTVAARPDPADSGEPAGPYDVSQAPSGVARLDLGSLKIPSVPGVEVRVQANQDGAVNQVYLVQGDSALQLGVFAAPRSEPIWDEVRAEIRRSLFADGVAAEEAAGEHGTELRARVRTQQGLKDLRFVGVSGPRWLVRAVYQGPAAVDPEVAGPLAACLRGVVVDRGEEAKPVKEPLPLRLSPELAAQLTGEAGGSGGAPAGAGSPGANGAPAPAGTVPAGNGVLPGSQPPASGASAGGASAGGAPADVPPAGGTPIGTSQPDEDRPPPRRRPSPRPRQRE